MTKRGSCGRSSLGAEQPRREGSCLGGRPAELREEWELLVLREAAVEAGPREVPEDAPSGGTSMAREDEVVGQWGQQAPAPARPPVRTPVPSAAAAAPPASRSTKGTSRRLCWRRNSPQRCTVREDIKQWEHDPE